MISKLYTAEIKLNRPDKHYTNYLMVINDNGVLLVNKGLFVLSFVDEDDLIRQEVEVKNKKYIGLITL